jgi:putative membrane protein
MVIESLAGLPGFIAYFCLASVAVMIYLFIYTWITPHDEFALIRQNVSGASIALGASLIGFSIPIGSVVANSAGFLDFSIWAVVALIVQILVFFAVRIPVPDVSNRIAAGELAAPIWLGLASITAGILNAAAMTY